AMRAHEFEHAIDVHAGEFVLRRPLDLAAVQGGALFRKVILLDQHAVAEALERGPRGLESILLRQRCVAYVASATHVPFAEVAGGVTGVAERSGDARRGWIEPIAHSVLAIDFARVKIRVDQVPRRTLAGGEADARRRADRCGAVELAEANAFPADRV